MKEYKQGKIAKPKYGLNSFVRDIPAWLLILPAILLLFIINWYPMLTGIKMAFYNNDGTMFVGLENFKTVLSDMLFFQALKNSVSYVLWSIVIGMFIPVVVAIMMNETVHGNSIIKASLYLPQVVPAIAGSLLWYFVYMADESGLLNMILSMFGVEPQVWLQDERLTIPLIIVSTTWRGFGFTAILYLASIQSINRELYEAAMIDGAGILKRTVKITLPHMYPMILLFGINQIKSIFNIMVEPLAMTGGGPNNASLSLGLQSYRYAFQYYRMADSVALSTIMWLIVIIITVFYRKIDKKLEQ